jgi:hypothetical protein
LTQKLTTEDLNEATREKKFKKNAEKHELVKTNDGKYMLSQKLINYESKGIDLIIGSTLAK